MGAFEQHGPHLPLATDALFAERILATVLSGLAAPRPDLEPALTIHRVLSRACRLSWNLERDLGLVDPTDHRGGNAVDVPKG